MLGLYHRASSILLSLPPDPGFAGGSRRSCSRRPNFQSGLATCIRCWSGFKKPSEVLQVWASSPQWFTVDPVGASPTFPTGWRDYDQIARLCSLRTQGWCTEVSPPTSCRCALPHQSAKDAVSAAAQNSEAAVLMDSQFCSGVFFYVTLFLRPLGLGLWLHGLSCTRSLLILCPVRRSLVSFPLLALGTIITWHGCTTRSWPCSQIILPSRWRNVGYLEVDDSFWVFSSGGFPVQSATGAPRHVRPRSAPASSLKGSSHYAVHPGSRPVSFPGRGDPHVFPAQSGVASTGLHTSVPDGSSLLGRAGYGSSHPPATRCPRADGTTSLKSVARTLMK